VLKSTPPAVLPGASGSTGAGSELRWLPLRVLSQVIASPLERYPARRWSGSLAAEIRRALTGGDRDRLVDLASALAWGMHELTPWGTLHIEGLMRESMVSALSAWSCSRRRRREGRQPRRAGSPRRLTGPRWRPPSRT